MTTEIQNTASVNESARKTLVLMRHAKSDWNDPSLSDHDRPLNRRGLRDAPVMAEWLAQAGHVPGLVLSSSAVRTRQTAAALREVWEPDSSLGAIEFNTIEDLYLSPPSTIADTVCQLSGDHDVVMVIAHNPGISQLTGMLSGEEVEMPTAAIAVFRLVLSRWSDLTMDVVADRIEFVWPKAL
jgi:phosphohistidine phosphatase